MNQAPARKPLRLWPGVVAVVLQWVGLLLVPRVAPDAALAGLLGAAVCALAVVVWWLFFSRAPWLERIGALALAPLAVLATRPFVDPTIAQAGMGNMMTFFSIPLLCLALVAWAAATRRLSDVSRRAALPVALLLGCLPFALVRSGGVSGDARTDFHWRWTPTPEEKLLAQGAEPLAPPPAPSAPADPSSPASEGVTPQPPAPAAVPVEKKPEPGAAASAAASASPSASLPAFPADWPGFRGPGRDGVVRGVRIATDWSASPPVRMWRRAVGPAWSSFAVHGELVYTQEQRGEEELVACYRLNTGEPVWRHGDPIRHWDSEGGPGPRATPAWAGGRVYSLGATGRLNSLDAGSGAVVWSRDAAADAGVEKPGWGFAGSPLVVGELVVVAVSGRLAAYDAASGERRWLGPEGGGGYSSPHLATIDGVPQVLLLRGSRSTSLAPADGALLWEHRGEPGAGIVQPALTGDGDVLVAGSGDMGGNGILRLAVTRGPAGWSVAERWSSTGLKPYFSDFVVHEGHAYGFDKNILAAIDLADGQRKWKGGRYGTGQLVLLPDQDLLLLLSEQGELVLVRATPEAFTEVAKVAAIEGKSWSHPVLVGDRLLVRNAQEMAAFRLARAAATSD
jgi:hypothetical protein